jgi:hypothetical protein
MILQTRVCELSLQSEGYHLVFSLKNTNLGRGGAITSIVD